MKLILNKDELLAITTALEFKYCYNIKHMSQSDYDYYFAIAKVFRELYELEVARDKMQKQNINGEEK